MDGNLGSSGHYWPITHTFQNEPNASVPALVVFSDGTSSRKTPVSTSTSKRQHMTLKAANSPTLFAMAVWQEQPAIFQGYQSHQLMECQEPLEESFISVFYIRLVSACQSIRPLISVQ